MCCCCAVVSWDGCGAGDLEMRSVNGFSTGRAHRASVNQWHVVENSTSDEGSCARDDGPESVVPHNWGWSHLLRNYVTLQGQNWKPPISTAGLRQSSERRGGPCTWELWSALDMNSSDVAVMVPRGPCNGTGDGCCELGDADHPVEEAASIWHCARRVSKDTGTEQRVSVRSSKRWPAQLMMNATQNKTSLLT